MVNKEIVTFSNEMSRIFLRSVYIDFIPIYFGLILIFWVSVMPGVTPDAVVIFLGIVLYMCVYFAFTGWYSKPFKDFVMKYMDIEPVSVETSLFLDRVGYDLVKYSSLFVDRDYTPESNIWG